MAIEDVLSDVFVLMDTVFQGTVLGPSLWNTFFHDVGDPASIDDGQVKMFADDLTVSKCFDLDLSNDEVVRDMTATRTEVHRWGKRNRVIFDPDKEHINVIHPVHGEGETFKLLGCLVDVKLAMDHAVEQVASRARPKIKALLRSRPYCDVGDMLTQFKTHIWGLIEYQHGAILHSCDSNLNKIDQLQYGFVRDIRITREMAFLDYNLAPLGLRRDIGILGFIHKRVLGDCHPSVKAFLRFSAVPDRWHDKQIETYLELCLNRPNLYWRSLF